MRGTFLLAAASGVIALATGQSAHAIQDDDGGGEAVLVVDAGSGIAIYNAAFFNAFSPVTALDMVNRVPGFSLSGGDTNRRGLGDSFGNLLINGARPANKSLSLDTVLQRIRVSNVERIELITEAMPQYDMRGHARLVNVVTREGSGNSGSWNTQLQMSDSGRLGPQGEISYTIAGDNLETTFGLYAHQYGNRINRRYVRVDPAEQPVEFQRDSDQRNWRTIRPSLSSNWQIDARSSLRFDANANFWNWERDMMSYIDGPGGYGSGLERLEALTTENSGTIMSGTATYSRDLTDRLSMQTIALVSREDWEDGPQYFTGYDILTGFDGSIILESAGDYEETAFRQTVSWDPNENNAFEFGAETALNARDTSLDLSSDDGTTITPIDLPVSSTRVEETRSEIFANHVWTASDRLSVESGLRYEFSEITQTGDANQSRTFSYPKPSITVNWRQDDNNRLRVTARRDVAQLDFGKFASSVDVSDNNSTLGNPDYVPQRTWTLEAEWERRIGEDGSFSLQVGHDWIQDLDGWVPITTPSGVFDAPGNIGDGTNLRITGNLTSPLDDFGLNNAVIDVFLEWYNTNVTDPLTFDDRPFSGYREWEIRLDYRQTFPDLQLAWGWDYHWVSDGEIFRAREYRVETKTEGDLDVYLETTRWNGVTARIGVDAVINNGDDRYRTFFATSRADGIVTGREYRNQGTGPTWYVQLRGTF